MYLLGFEATAGSLAGRFFLAVDLFGLRVTFYFNILYRQGALQYYV